MTRELYEQYLSQVEQLAPPPSTPPLTTLFIEDSDDEEWAATFGKKHTSIEHDLIQMRKLQESELERFMNDALDTSMTTTENGEIVKRPMEPLRWWRGRGEHLYPTLAGMAYDLIAMLAMSSECERAFSSAKRLIAE
jgi:hypothetical protein